MMKEILFPQIELVNEHLRAFQNPGSLPRGYRHLSEEEETFLEKEGNLCTDWDRIKVTENFSPHRIRNCTFRGDCFLDSPRILINSTLNQVIIEGGAAIEGTGLVENCFVGKEAEIFHCGRILGVRENPFGLNLTLDLGCETGGRRTRVTPVSTLQEVSRAALDREAAFQESWDRECLTLIEALKIPWTVIGSRARLYSVPLLRNSFIGPWSLLENPSLVEDSFLFGDADYPDEAPRISSSAVVKHCFLQPGSRVETMAVAEASLLGEHSEAERHGKVTQSYIAPNTVIAEGEVTSSLVGPFVGFHHQALLIGALWPQGSGNVAYGANVGSNHTGRLPDQELYGSRGLFFGLGCSIKYPADFSEAPFSLIATGITTLPQKISFPFSLINQPSRHHPGVPPAFNELIPGWVFQENHYHLRRTEEKEQSRNKARYHQPAGEIMTPETARLVYQALLALNAPKEPKSVYTEQDIRGLGKNYLTEENRKRGIEAYATALKSFLLEWRWKEHQGKEGLEYPERRVHESAVGIQKWTLPESLAELSRLEILFLDWINNSREKDDLRGEHLRGRDYSLTHPSAADDPFIIRRQEAVKTKRNALRRAIEELS